MHMNRAFLLQGDVHELTIAVGGSVELVADNGLDILILFLRRKSDYSEEIVVNNCIDGEWGEERSFQISLTSDDRDPSIWFKLSEGELEIWTTVVAGYFERFSDIHRQRVRFVRSHMATNVGASLSTNLETVDYTAVEIEAHLLYRRMDALERRLSVTKLSKQEMFDQ
mmetsp:Transcript_12158/g.15887  ORF Transcript_12158/g.15887 Transcript_12158/m.15887 type:complete len:168 (+) Transcript_12158:209-712(+)